MMIPPAPSMSVFLIRPARLRGSSSLAAPLCQSPSLTHSFSRSLQPLTSPAHHPGGLPLPPPSFLSLLAPLLFLNVAEEETLARSLAELTRGNGPVGTLVVCISADVSCVAKPFTSCKKLFPLAHDLEY